MKDRRAINYKSYARSWIAIALMITWTLAALSGVLLWLAPHVPRAGHQLLLFGITKREWGEIHFWICIIAICITVIHVAVDWKGLRGCIRYLVKVHRPKMIDEGNRKGKLNKYY